MFNPEDIQKNVSLAPLSTFKIGGKAKLFVSVETSKDLIKAVKWAQKNNLSFKIFAGGSNLVFPDQDPDCLVIRVLGGKVMIKGNRVIVDVGVLLADLIQKTVAAGLGGLEKLIGIPGTVGGALVGNAGAYGQAIADIVEKVEVWNGKKQRWLSKKECCFNYRHSIFKERPYLIFRASLWLDPKNQQSLKQVCQEVLEKRKGKIPAGINCAGCFFKNILVKNLNKKALSLINQSKIVEGKIPTGYLLEQVGAKGMKIGGIKVADFHANFLINMGHGKASEVKKLAQILKRKVKEKFNIELEEEIRYF